MELSNKFLDGTWTKDNNGKPKFFIINEAIISKLCILGEELNVSELSAEELIITGKIKSIERV